jgi:hypothetical protein
MEADELGMEGGGRRAKRKEERWKGEDAPAETGERILCRRIVKRVKASIVRWSEQQRRSRSKSSIRTQIANHGQFVRDDVAGTVNINTCPCFRSKGLGIETVNPSLSIIARVMHV